MSVARPLKRIAIGSRTMTRTTLDPAPAEHDPTPEQIVAGFAQRVDDMFGTDSSKPPVRAPTGSRIDYEPEKVLDRPFLGADYNRDGVTIRKDGREKNLDFNPRAKEQ